MRLKIILLGFILFTFAPLARAQNTSVTATITDSDGQAWFKGSYTITFVANPSFSGPYNFNGSPMTAAQQGPYTGVLDNTGSFTVSLPSNALIAPAGTQWLFVICPYASAKCGQITTAVSGSSVNLTSLLSAGVPAPRFSAISTGAYGYSTTEIKEIPVPGGSFWNVTLLCQDAWNGTIFSCTSGGAGNPGSPPLSLQFANPGGTGFQSATCTVNGVSATFEIDSGTSTTRVDDPCNTFFASGVPYYDVQSAVFGAKCDGTTDDSTAIAAALAAMNANLGGNAQSPGVLYFSRAAHPCKFNGNVFAAITSSNPKYVLMDNSFLLTGSVEIAAYGWTFIGRAGTYQGLGGSQAFSNTVTWASNGAYPALDIGQPVQTLDFENINFITLTSSAPSAVHIHDNCTGGPNVPAGCGGPVYMKFINDSFQPATSATVPLAVDSSASGVTSEFGLIIRDSTIQAVAGQPYAMTLINGAAHIMDTNFGAGGILWEDNGISFMADLEIDSVYSENLANQSFLTINSTNGSADSSKLTAINIADPVGNVYVVKNIGAQTHSVDIEDTISAGTGMLDPASSEMSGLICKGQFCSAMIPTNNSNANNLIIEPGDGRGFYDRSISGFYPAVSADGGFATDLVSPSGAVTLSHSHYWYNVNGTTTIPHATAVSGFVQNQWEVFNISGSSVTVQCDSGTINSVSTVTLASFNGGLATSNGTNCFLNMGGEGSGGTSLPANQVGVGTGSGITSFADFTFTDGPPVLTLGGTNQGSQTLGSSSATSPSFVACYGGSGATNTNPCYFELFESPAGVTPAFLYACNSGQVCVSTSTPAADSTQNLIQNVARGTATMTTAAISAGACGSTVTVSAPGVATTDTIIQSYNAAVTSNPGVLTVNRWPTANNVNFAYCNPTAGSVTPTAATLNWQVNR